jgi:hypothetical protein
VAGHWLIMHVMRLVWLHDQAGVPVSCLILKLKAYFDVEQ